MSFEKKIMELRLFKFLFNQRSYMEIGSNQINFLTSKLTMIMSVTYISDKYFDFQWSGSQMSVVIVGTLAGMWLLGFVWKKFGMYGAEREREVKMNPTGRVVLESAEIIKKWEAEGVFERFKQNELQNRL
jgi:hypothetical protein